MSAVLNIVASFLSLFLCLHAKPFQGIDSLSGDSIGEMSERSLDAELGDNMRSIDSIGGGNLIRDLQYLMDERGQHHIDTQGLSHLRSLDSIGGGNVIRHVPVVVVPAELADNLRNHGYYVTSLGGNDRYYRRPGYSKRLDTLGGMSLGQQKRNLDEINRQAFDTFAKRNLDEIGRSSFGGFAKRNLDEIDRSGFGGFSKRNFDEINRSGFGGFAKRNLDEIDRSGFGGFAKRSVDESDMNGAIEKRSAAVAPLSPLSPSEATTFDSTAVTSSDSNSKRD